MIKDKEYYEWLEYRISELEKRLDGWSSPSGEEGNMGIINENEIQHNRIDKEISEINEKINVLMN